MTINERLRPLRKALNLKQIDFANSIGVKQSSLSNYESGSRPVPDVVIKNICITHNVSETWLRDGEGEMFGTLDEAAKLAATVAGLFDERTSPTVRKLVTMIANLDDDAVKRVESFIRDLAASLPPEDQ